MLYKCVQELLGDGGETAVRVSDVLVLDEDEIYRNTKSPTPLFKEGRIVTNLMDESNDFSGWSYLQNIASKVYTDGSTKITSSSTSDPYLGETVTPGNGTLADRSFIWSVWLWTDSGQPTDAILFLYDLSVVNVASKTVTLTTVPQRFTVSNTLGSSEADTIIIVRIDLSETSTGYLYANKGQVEESTGKSDLTIPSEYVETSGSELTDIYACANGNSVDVNGVVTDAIGAILTSTPYQHYQQAGTNVCLHSNDFSNTAWIKTNTGTYTQDQAGLSGVANRAWTLDDADSGAVYQVQQDITTSGSDTVFTAKFWIKKDTDISRFPAFQINITDSGGLQAEVVGLNTFTGATSVVNSIGSESRSHEVTAVGDWWLCIIELEATTPASASVFCKPAQGSTLGANDVTATGSTIFGQVEIYVNKRIDDVRTLAPIITTIASVTTNDSIYTWASTNHDNTEGGYYLELDWTGGDQDILLFGGTAILYISSGNLTLDDGTTTTTIAISAGEHQIGFAYGSSNMRLNLNDSWATAATYDDAFPIGAITSEASIRELKGKDNTYANAQTWIEGEMA